MPEVKLSLQFEGSKESKILTVMFSKQDSLSFIAEEMAAEIANLQKLPNPKKVLLNGQSLEATHAIVTDFYIHGVRLSDEFLVVKHMAVNAIINDATIRKWRIKVNEEEGSVYVHPAKARLKLI